MAREIQENNGTRLVLTGPTTQPTEIWAEYRIVDGDLAEDPQRLNFKGMDFGAKIKDLWSGMVAQIKAVEKL